MGPCCPLGLVGLTSSASITRCHRNCPSHPLPLPSHLLNPLDATIRFFLLCSSGSVLKIGLLNGERRCWSVALCLVWFSCERQGPHIMENFVWLLAESSPYRHVRMQERSSYPRIIFSSEISENLC